jgi:hypothetical protein
MNAFPLYLAGGFIGLCIGMAATRDTKLASTAYLLAAVLLAVIAVTILPNMIVNDPI